MSESWDAEKCLLLFSEFLRFETVSALGFSNGAYNNCADWLVENFKKIGFQSCTILHESVPNKPIVIAEWLGSDPTLQCIFLNCHYDVVPDMTDFWSVPAFEGLRRDGRTYGRGAQDMKCVCVQYLIAMQSLKCQGYIPLRTIRLSFVPDEEIGGTDGMLVLLNSKWFKEYPIGIALDEVFSN